MSNNKQSIKLYTEEQVRQSFRNGFIYANLNEINENQTIDSLTPIELPSDDEIWKWWQTQKFQKAQGEQEYTMLFEIDLPKILKAFIENFSKIQGGNK